MSYLFHNIENKELVNNFAKKSKEDDLYKIRFFNKNEIEQIVKNSGIKYKNIKILKFGGLIDAFYRKKLKKIVPNIIYPFSKFMNS